MESSQFYCNQCMNLLGHVNFMTGDMHCPSCKNIQSLPENNKVISISYHNEGQKEITDAEIEAVGYEQTTPRIEKKCPNKDCDAKMMSKIRDSEYNYILFCMKCRTIYR